MKSLLLAALSVVLGGCGEQAPAAASGLSIRLEAATAEVHPGEVFALRVERAWPEGLIPEAWDDAALAPLVVRSTGVGLRRAAGRKVETREFLALAACLEDIALVPTLRARDPRSGEETRVTGPALALRVVPVLDPAAPGPPEGPVLLEPLPASLGEELLRSALALTALAVAFFSLQRRARAPVIPTAPPPPSPEARARALLAALDPHFAADREANAAFHAAVAGVLRGYLEERGLAPASRRTTDETLAAPRLRKELPAAARARVAAVLRRCDLILFAAAEASSREREGLVTELSQLLEEAA